MAFFASLNMLSRLEILSLNQNPIRRTVEDVALNFEPSALHTLYLNGNQLEWSQLLALDSLLPHLRRLYARNALIDLSNPVNQYRLVANLPKLTELNGNMVIDPRHIFLLAVHINVFID